MSEQDRIRWDVKWAERSPASFEAHPVLLKLKDIITSGEVSEKGGLALDLACGRGQNSFVLAEIGYRVVGLDISSVALTMASNDARSLGFSGAASFAQVDLDLYVPAANHFDLICVTRFLDRRLLSEIPVSVKPGGLVVYATRPKGALEIYPEAKTSYLLEYDELPKRFPGWQVLHYHQGPVEAELVAKKPTFP